MKWYKTSRKSSILVCLHNSIKSIALCDAAGLPHSLFWKSFVTNLAMCGRGCCLFQAGLRRAWVPLSVSGLAGPIFTSQGIYKLYTVSVRGVRAAFSPRRQPSFLGSV